MNTNFPIKSDAHESLQASLAKLSTLADKQPDMWLRMLEAYKSKFYPVDLLAVGALNRSAGLCSGFRTMIEQRNFTCAASILRLQLDNALRFFATFLVQDPHEFATAVVDGTHVRKLKDKSGALMTDAHLVIELSKEFPWIASVYKATSGYIHFSERHVYGAVDSTTDEGRLISIKLGSIDDHLPEATFIEAVEAFCAATEVFHRYVEGWIYTKANPDKLAKRRDARKTKQ